jgi:hypothetical protein
VLVIAGCPPGRLQAEMKTREVRAMDARNFFVNIGTPFFGA